MTGVVQFAALAIQLYIFLIIIWVFSSWFPQWRYQSWFRTVNDLVEPYLRLFQRLPLRVGMIDLSPMVAIIVLQILRAALVGGMGRGY